MLKIYYNEKDNSDTAIKLTIKEDYCKVEITSDDGRRSGADVIENMLPYNSYALVDNTNGSTKIYRRVTRSDYQWLDLNRLGVAMKMDFADIVQLYGTYSLIQADTGVMADDEKDIIVRLFTVDKDKIEIDADQEYELLAFNSDDLALGSHPRRSLWDSYSLTADWTEYKANDKGYFTDDTDAEHIIPAAESIAFTITKYKGDFSSGEKLERDYDDEEVLVDCSAGCANNRRVRLENGVGHFVLYTLGYTGPIKIKLGRKWYEVWNEYNLVIGGENNGASYNLYGEQM
ncbi:MAG: hypothetical protein LUG91_09060 [Ruminococcus sp.]|nr:hypothetical protein [Ruminococcus sp.]